MPSTTKATAKSYSNIAFVKYWGNRDDLLRIPANGSISMNLSETATVTTVEFTPDLAEDSLEIDGRPATEPARQRAGQFLDVIREMTGRPESARVVSHNNFPMGTGIASSASAFSALTLAACTAASIELSEKQLSALARRGSGSACRSIPGGFVEWFPGLTDASSYAIQIAPPDYWPLRDIVVIVSSRHKNVGSAEGHILAWTSPFYTTRLNHLPERLHRMRAALLLRDLRALGEECELEALELHTIAMTSATPVIYWDPATLEVMQAVQRWREEEGLGGYFTLDAGANVHILCAAADAERLAYRLRPLPGVHDLIINSPAPGTHLLEEHLF
ncbi:MAG: diphosphomevalonate decarboxylase [Chloroflexi bacterium]|nr:diphosphomevalonate decarboxylase [Chloroflexota bacterium]